MMQINLSHGEIFQKNLWRRATREDKQSYHAGHPMIFNNCNYSEKNNWKKIQEKKFTRTFTPIHPNGTPKNI